MYLATRVFTSGFVAVKVLRDVPESSPVWHRATREVGAMVRLKGHPNVVSVEEIVDGHEGPCIVMEYVPGGSLADRLDVAGRLSPGEVVFVGGPSGLGVGRCP